MLGIISQYHINLMFRMLVSCLCGIAIGFERNNRAKEAGVRTHCIVACASALMMIISKYGFMDLVAGMDGMRGADGSRIAAQVISGIGFLGAGIIYVQRSNIRGLTTAAGLWATSGIGLAIGGGMYTVGLAATVLVLAAQLVLHTSGKFMVSHKNKLIKVYGIEEAKFQDRTTAILKDMQVMVNEVAIERHSNGLYDYTFYCEMPGNVKEEDIINCFENKCKVDITR